MTRRHEHFVRQLSVLSEIDACDDFSLTMEDIFRRLVETLAFGLATENCSLMLLDPTGQYLSLRAACSAIDERGKSFQEGEWKSGQFRLGEGIVGRVAQTGKVIRVDDVTKEKEFVRKGNRQVDIRSLLCFPLRSEEKTVGVLNFSHSTPGFFTVDEEGILGLVASRIARLMVSHQLHRQLLESEEHYRLVSQSAGDGILVFDAEGLMLDANPAVEQMAGIPASQFRQGKTDWESIVCPDDKASFLKHRASVIESNVPTTLDYRIVDAKGDIHFVEQRSSPMHGASGQCRGVVCVVRDITEVKNAEREKAELEAQLRQSQKIEAVGMLAGGIAHDFNNILYAILGYTDLAMRGLPADSPIRERLAGVIKAATRAADLVSQILTFSRQTKKKRKPILIQEVVEETLKLMRELLPTTIEIRGNVAAGCGPVLADPTEIQQVIMNLCTNSYHAMREHAGILTVSLEQVKVDHTLSAGGSDPPPGHYAKLSVSDTGHGMDKATLERIFLPYFTTKKVGEGTGLGLATVHGIVKSHEGVITVHSEPGRGTTFDIFFPLCAQAAKTPEEEDAEILPQKSDCRILFVDDEEIIAQMGKEILEVLGYKVESRTGSVEALEVFRADPAGFDLVIADQTMPNLTGAELARQLMKIRPDVPVILCTGFSDTVNEQQAKAIGIREYVMKPIVTNDLVKAIERALRSHQDGGNEVR
jgi:PAS domain S-box-containing protein